MGFEYALVHLEFTIPPAILLTLLYRPLFTRIDYYKLAFLITIALVSTIPWDDYLIRRKIWTYPQSVIIGPRLFSIPAEEVFFFVIQTYNTSLLYLLLSKLVFYPSYLAVQTSLRPFVQKLLGQIILVSGIVIGGILVCDGGPGTYLGLIMVWAGPFALLLWSLSSQFLTSLPYTNTLVPIAIPTFYLWIVDTLALKRGTWAIESGTKIGIHLWEGLEIEEAIFFLATNTLIVFGLVAFDHAIAILLTFPRLFPVVPELPSPMTLIRALLISDKEYDNERIKGIKEAAQRLENKSRSFYLASSTFSGRLRIDLILLYSFCRVADDLVDNARTQASACDWIRRLNQFVSTSYESKLDRMVSKHPDPEIFIKNKFPDPTKSALRMLPTHVISSGPLYGLLEGFKIDLKFQDRSPTNERNFPIATEEDLRKYASYVAGTVAELMLQLVFHHSSLTVSVNEQLHLTQSGAKMGIALQYVNIARDIATDAKIGRVYLPTSWLKEAGLTPQDVLNTPNHPKIEPLRSRLLVKAFEVYKEANVAIAQLPGNARGPMRVAVESYMEIGRVMQERGYTVKEGKATVPILKRLKVAWMALNDA